VAQTVDVESRMAAMVGILEIRQAEFSFRINYVLYRKNRKYN